MPREKTHKVSEKESPETELYIEPFSGPATQLILFAGFCGGGLLLEPEALSPMPVFSHNFS